MLPAILLVICVGLFLYLFLEVMWFTASYEIKKIKRSLRDQAIKTRYKDAAPDAKMRSLLETRVNYFKRLPQKLKNQFMVRTALFMNHHSFEGREGLVVTEEMATLISATAVQLTFGLRDFYLDHFDTFILYPDIYASTATGALHRGETNVKGVIVLSWKHFEEGIATEADKLNLGLHELAHALDLSRLVRQGDPYFFKYFQKWLVVAEHGPDEVAESEQHFLREYAGTNPREFFAVSVEHFFEDPEGFSAELPLLYRHLTILLRQDPLRLKKFADPTPQWISNQPTPQQLAKKLLASDYNVFYGIGSILLPLLIIVLFMVVLRGEYGGQSIFMIAVSGIMFCGGCVDFFRRAKQIEIYEDFVIVRSVFTGGLLFRAAIDNLISIEYNSGDVRDVRFTYVEEGEVLQYSFYSRLDRNDFEKIKSAMENRDVLMTR